MAEAMERLTVREAEILWMVIDDGMTNKAIAARLGIAECTVKRHVQRIYSKWGVSVHGSGREMVSMLIKAGYLAWMHPVYEPPPEPQPLQTILKPSLLRNLQDGLHAASLSLAQARQQVHTNGQGYRALCEAVQALHGCISEVVTEAEKGKS